jgi:hypothetical protein
MFTLSDYILDQLFEFNRVMKSQETFELNDAIANGKHLSQPNVLCN